MIYRGPNFYLNEPSRCKQRAIRCHAGLDPASSFDFWIPAFAGMTFRHKRAEYKKENANFSPSPADCKKLSIYSQHPSPQREGTIGNPAASCGELSN
jgi:hypothetical protein